MQPNNARREETCLKEDHHETQLISRIEAWRSSRSLCKPCPWQGQEHRNGTTGGGQHDEEAGLDNLADFRRRVIYETIYLDCRDNLLGSCHYRKPGSCSPRTR